MYVYIHIYILIFMFQFNYIIKIIHVIIIHETHICIKVILIKLQSECDFYIVSQDNKICVLCFI